MMLDLTDPVSPHDQEMLVFRVPRDAQRAPGIVGRDADAIAGNGFGKFARTDQEWPLQTLTVPQFLGPRDVFRDGNRKQQA